MERDYIFHQWTMSFCPTCFEKLPSKIIIKNNSVFLSRTCPQHGELCSFLEEDAPYYLNRHFYDKPGTKRQTQTESTQNCPSDCGLCPDHEQHTCLGLLEITNQCDLACPVCYAFSSQGAHLSLSKIEQIMDFYQDSEDGKAEILQISGGEPTQHPDILKIIEMAKTKKFRYVMLNTNGIRISEDENFVQALAQFRGGFEIYLQFDGFKEQTHLYLRGKDLRRAKEKAIELLAKYKIPITLVSTIEQGVNDDEIGAIVNFGMSTPFVRGINFQPVAYFGRKKKNADMNRITLTGILNRIEQQTQNNVRKSDFIPLPCNVEKVAVTYFYRQKGGLIPITRHAKIRDYLPLVKNTFAFDASDVLKQTADELLKGNVCECLSFLKDFLPVVPLTFYGKSKEEKIAFVDENTFRISVTSFLDADNFDIKSIKKECVHVLTPDFKKIPFSVYNIFHRKL